MIRLLALPIVLAVLASGCVDQRACEACITNQMELRAELIAQGYEVRSVGTLQEFRGACTRASIAPSQPCAPKLPVFRLLGLVTAVVCVVLWLRRGRERTSRSP